MRTLFAMLACLVVAAGCANPPPQAFVGGTASGAASTALGADASGETCNQLPGDGPDTADIFCGSWHQPAALVRGGATGWRGRADGLATGSAWRDALDQRLICQAPARSTILGDQPAVLLQCTRRIGGWPQVALVASVDGRTWLADGILPTMPVMERSIGILSGPDYRARGP